MQSAQSAGSRKPSKIPHPRSGVHPIIVNVIPTPHAANQRPEGIIHAHNVSIPKQIIRAVEDFLLASAASLMQPTMQPRFESPRNRVPLPMHSPQLDIDSHRHERPSSIRTERPPKIRRSEQPNRLQPSPNAHGIREGRRTVVHARHEHPSLRSNLRKPRLGRPALHKGNHQAATTIGQTSALEDNAQATCKQAVAANPKAFFIARVPFTIGHHSEFSQALELANTPNPSPPKFPSRVSHSMKTQANGPANR